MTKLSVLILMLCILATIINVVVAGNYGRKHYQDDEEDSSEEIRELARKTARENRFTQEEIRQLREELQRATANEHNLTQEEIYRLRNEVDRLRVEERINANRGDNQESGGLFGKFFELKKRILEKHLHFLGK